MFFVSLPQLFRLKKRTKIIIFYYIADNIFCPCMILMRGDAANIYFQWKARHAEDSATMNLY